MFLNGHALPVVNEIKDFRIIVDSRLTFVAHVNKIVARASICAYLIHVILPPCCVLLQRALNV